MPASALDVIGIGNAIVDVIVRIDDAFVSAHGLAKGAMILVDQAQGEQIYAAMGSAVEISGGSAANTMTGIASFGGKGGYIGRVRDDQLGDVFRHDIRAAGVVFESKSATAGASTARSLILVSPDAQRTMVTFLGACAEFGPEDLDHSLIASAKIAYLEGYLFDRPSAKQAFVQAAKTAHEAGAKVSLSLSDSFCVDRHLTEFQALVADHIDILFANEAEILALTGAASFDQAVVTARGACEIAAVTRGAKGSVVITQDRVIEIPAEPVEQVIDTTGAGDLYAAGFLYGYTQGFDLPRCGAHGSLAAGEIISHIGARPAVSLKTLAAKRFA